MQRPGHQQVGGHTLAAETGGSLLITTSARTPKATADALLSAIDSPAFAFPWSRDGGENPFYGMPGLEELFGLDALQRAECADAKPRDHGEGNRDGHGARDREQCASERYRAERQEQSTVSTEASDDRGQR